jgi:hypothetical protein
MTQLRHLHDCLFANPQRRREFLRSPNQVATAWNSAIISLTGLNGGPDVRDGSGGCERAFSMTARRPDRF